MYFYLDNGKQVLDLKGDLILSFNDELVKTRVPSAGPKQIKAPDGYVKNIGKAGFFKRIGITFRIIGFVWGKNKELKREDTNHRESYRANLINMNRLDCCKKHGGSGVKSGCPQCTSEAI